MISANKKKNIFIKKNYFNILSTNLLFVNK